MDVWIFFGIAGLVGLAIDGLTGIGISAVVISLMLVSAVYLVA